MRKRHSNGICNRDVQLLVPNLTHRPFRIPQVGTGNAGPCLVRREVLQQDPRHCQHLDEPL